MQAFVECAKLVILGRIRLSFDVEEIEWITLKSIIHIAHVESHTVRPDHT